MALDEEDLASNVREADLCARYGDHEECPYKEVDENGDLVICSCACHLFPGSQPE